MMCCPIVCISVLLALLVLLGGLFLLAYAKKEGLGKMTKFASYVAIVISTGMIICCIICMLMCCGGHKGGKCGGGKCGPGEMSVHKKMMMKHHGGMNHHGNCCKGDDKACDHHHGEKDAKAEADTIK